jgi:hypothetical protein
MQDYCPSDLCLTTFAVITAIVSSSGAIDWTSRLFVLHVVHEQQSGEA